jgi:glutaconyl-CoA decarboxylase
MPLYRVTVNGALYEVEIADPFAASAEVTVNGERYSVAIEETRDDSTQALAQAVAAPRPAPVVAPAPAPRPAAPAAPAPRPAPSAAVDGKPATAPMPGKILRVLVKEGDAVPVGGVLMVLEAMKMENEIRAQVAGTVRELRVSAGDTVKPGEVLAVIG